MSPLISRYYGLMLGFFSSLLRLSLPEPSFRSHRIRIEEVIGELGMDVEFPATHAEYLEQFASFSARLTAELKKRDLELLHFFGLGFHALRVLVDGDDASDAARIARQNFDAVIERYSLDGAALRELVAPGWDGGRRDEALSDELVGRLYRIAGIAIWPLPKQERVCFVIMPFSEPFRSYYQTYYRRTLELAGYECLRAWVGLSNELYLMLLATLISRCDAALADISAESGTMPNLNVIHEVGLNMGFENVTFLIRNESTVAIPSNFTGLPIAEYAADDPDPVALASALALGAS